MSVNAEQYAALENCVRNVFGRVMWSHKIQEKQADIYSAVFRALSVGKIVLSGITSAGLVSLLFIDPYWLKLTSAILSCCSTILIAVTKQYDYESIIRCHRNAATKYLAVKDRIMLLLLRIKLHSDNYEILEKEFDSILTSVGSINESAPQTTSCAVKKAARALKVHKDDDISNKEIDGGLPLSLRNGDVND